MNTTEQYKLARLVKRILDVIWYLLISAAVVWLITVIVVGINIPSEPEQRTTDINAFFGFKFNPEVTSESSAWDALISGHSEIKINNTAGLLAWYLAGIIDAFMAAIFLYGLLHLRRLFASLSEGESFAQENAERLKKIGFAFIGWHLIYPLMQYFGGRFMLKEIALNVQGLQLYASFEFNLGGIIAGLAIIVLAGILREAASIQQEQLLTI